MPSVKKIARAAIDQVDAVLLADERMPSNYRKLFDLLLFVIRAFLGVVGANSTNSSLPPSKDPHRPRGTRKKGKGKKRAPGGQPGREARFLEQVDDPDEVHTINIDMRCLPHGNYEILPAEKRQIIELEVVKKVIEYRVEVLSNGAGDVFRAPFPAGVNHPVQYGSSVKIQAVYMSQFQLVPYERLSRYFGDTCDIRLSQGSILKHPLIKLRQRPRGKGCAGSMIVQILPKGVQPIPVASR